MANFEVNFVFSTRNRFHTAPVFEKIDRLNTVDSVSIITIACKITDEKIKLVLWLCKRLVKIFERCSVTIFLVAKIQYFSYHNRRIINFFDAQWWTTKKIDVCFMGDVDVEKIDGSSTGLLVCNVELLNFQCLSRCRPLACFVTIFEGLPWNIQIRLAFWSRDVIMYKA